LPETYEVFIELKAEYKKSKHRLKEMKMTPIAQFSDQENYNYQLERSTKFEMKKIIKATEALHPEWKKIKKQR
jgi:hypothetical protein